MRTSLRLPSLLGIAVALLSACSSLTPDAPAALETQAALTVTSEADSGPGSLREAITTASSGDTITFADGVATITLSSGLGIGTDLTIAGPEGRSVTVSGNNTVRVFVMDTGTKVELRNLSVTGGFADTSGGGILNRGTLTVTNSTVAGNRANHYGGGIYNEGGTLTLINSAVSGNSVGYGGGGIDNRGTFTLTNSTVSGNSASNNGGYGGGIGNQGTLAVTNSTVAGNSAYYGGGIVNYATLTVTNSTVSGNSGGYGGGIYNTLTLTVTNSTVSGNGAYLGGGVAASAGTFNLNDSIVALNSDSAGFPDIRGSVSSGSNNIVGGNPGLELGNDGKPKLADNGGPTKTIALLAGSPALDVASSASCPAADQRGVTRPQGGGCDIGAFELEVVVADTTPPTITPTVSGTLGSNGWYTSDVTVSWGVADDESAITSQTGCDSTTLTTDTSGVTLTCEATSAGGTDSKSVTIKRDATKPALEPTVSPNPVLLNGSATATPNASDATSGIASQTCGALNTSSVGSKSVSCTATDNAGNTDTASLNYTVTYTFSGFFAPVDNLPTLNKAKAGQAVPLKWRLTDANGAPITNLANVQVSVVSLSCSLGTTPDALEEYAAGGSGLQNLGNGYYQFNWKTPKSYAGSCKTLRLDLGEGLYRTAAFQFTR